LGLPITEFAESLSIGLPITTLPIIPFRVSRKLRKLEAGTGRGGRRSELPRDGVARQWGDPSTQPVQE
jgi:hypothetical protein